MSRLDGLGIPQNLPGADWGFPGAENNPSFNYYSWWLNHPTKIKKICAKSNWIMKAPSIRGEKVKRFLSRHHLVIPYKTFMLFSPFFLLGLLFTIAVLSPTKPNLTESTLGFLSEFLSHGDSAERPFWGWWGNKWPKSRGNPRDLQRYRGKNPGHVAWITWCEIP